MIVGCCLRMLCCWLALSLASVAFAAPMGSEAPANPPAASAPILVILPFANYTGQATAVERLMPSIRERLGLLPVEIVPYDETRQVLRRHRIRAVGWVDLSGARALVEDLNANLLLTGSIDLLSDGRIPEFGLSVRLINARSLRVVWAVSEGATGDDFVTVFGLGQIRSMDELIERVLDKALATLDKTIRARSTPLTTTYPLNFIASDGELSDALSVDVTIVQPGNRTPILSPIAALPARETAHWHMGVSASDPDGTHPRIMVSGLPAGAEFLDHGNGTGSIDWTPGFADAGVYDMTFIASDGVAADSQTVAITVQDEGNQSPVLSAIADQITTEDSLIRFEISASDPDETLPLLGAVNLPTGATLIDNGDGTGSFAWIPGFADAGVRTITIVASDGGLADSQSISITVTDAGNQPPALAIVGDLGTHETVPLRFHMVMSDPDGTVPHLQEVDGIPESASFFTLTGTRKWTFEWTPGLTEAGHYPMTFIVTDGFLADTESVVITVGDAGNQTPILSAIESQRTVEGVALSFDVSAHDLDGTTPHLFGVDLPDGVDFSDNGDGTGTLQWTPGFTEAGAHTIRLVASDGALTDSKDVIIAVDEAGNQPPILAEYEAPQTTENVNLTFSVAAQDPDGTIPSLSAANLPEGASFAGNDDGTGTLDWTPGFTDAGEHEIIITASDGSLTNSTTLTITVMDAGNQPPALETVEVTGTVENTQIQVGMRATDPDGEIPSLSAIGLPERARLADHLDGTATLEWTPDSTQIGMYRIAVFASDGALADTQIATIHVVQPGNHKPALIANPEYAAAEADRVIFGVSAIDADETVPSLQIANLPGTARFVDQGDGSATFTWTTDFNSSGIYDLLLIATEGVAADSQTVTLTIREAGNQPPAIASLPDQHAIENVPLQFRVSATDPDDTNTSLQITNLPFGATFTDSGDGTGSFDWTPGFADAGVHALRVIASDGRRADTIPVTIGVNDTGNQAPVLSQIGPSGTTEGLGLSIPVAASDPDGTSPALHAENLPAGASFIDRGNGTGTLTWTPGFTDAGEYPVVISASDGVSEDTEEVMITIGEAGNQAPVIGDYGAPRTTENVRLTFDVSAVDADGTTPRLHVVGLPDSATFVDNGDGTGTVDWTPTFAHAGIHMARLIASDGAEADTEFVIIVVRDAGNQAPDLLSVEPRELSEQEHLIFEVSASDPDMEYPILRIVDLPSGALFEDHGDGTGTLDWTPSYVDAGVQNVTVIASDGSLADSETVTITVHDAGNQAPILSEIPPHGVMESTPLRIDILAFDPDATIPTLTPVGLPPGAEFIDNKDGSGVLDWTPGSIDDLARGDLALVTFDDLVPQSNGGRIVTAHILSQLVAEGFQVVEPGAIRELSLELRRIPMGEIDHELLNIIHDSLGATSVVTGIVDLFRISASDAVESFPAIELSGRLIDARSGRIRTIAEVALDGDRGRFFGMGGIRSTSNLARAVTESLLRKLRLREELGVALH